MLTLTTNIQIGPLDAKPTTQLSEYNFNSYVNVGGKYYAVNDDGLYEITGDTFDGDPIQAYFEPMTTDLSYVGRKRLRYIYVEINCLDDIEVTITADRNLIRTVTLTPNELGWHYIRVATGRDSAGAYFNFQVRNVNGGDFKVGTMRVLTYPLAKGFY